jgi:ceramide glucosyltransferase
LYPPEAGLVISAISTICAVAASLGCLYLLAAIRIVLLRKQKQKANPAPEPVTILKPLHGAEPRLRECLASFCVQDYLGPVQIIFGLQDAHDPALAVVNSLKDKFQSLDIGITVNETAHGANAKVSNLINMNATAKHDILIAVDSDILAPPDYLEQVATLLQKPKAGAVSVLYYGETAGPVWSRFAAAWINTHFLPSVLVGMALGLAKPCFGSTIALKREVLERIGGFEAFADQLADDYAIGAAVRKAGFSVEIGPGAVAHVCHEESLRDLLRHQLRWARTIRSIDLPGYLGSFIAHPFGLALLGVALGSMSCLALAVLALGLRIGLNKAVERSFELARQHYWVVPITDLIAFSVFVWSFFGTSVTWKRASFSVLGDGTIVQPEANSWPIRRKLLASEKHYEST